LGPLEALLAGESGPLTPEVLDGLQRIRRNAVRLHTLVNDLLDFSKLEAGKLTVAWRAVTPFHVVSQLVEDAQALAEQRGIAWHGPDPARAPSIVALDRACSKRS